MPINTLQTLEIIRRRKEELAKEKSEHNKWREGYNRIDTDYRELKRLHDNIQTETQHLTQDLKKEQQDKTHIQKELEGVRRRLNNAQEVINNKPTMIDQATETELTTYQIEKMEKRLKHAVKMFEVNQSERIKNKGLLRRIAIADRQIDNLAKDKANLTEKGQAIQERIDNLTTELEKSQISEGDLKIRLEELEEVLKKEKSEYEKSLEIKQSEWDELYKTLQEIEKQAKKKDLLISQLERSRNHLDGEITQSQLNHERTIQKLKREIEGLEEQLREKNQELKKSSKEKNDNLQQQIDNIQQDLDNESWYYEEEREQLQTSLNQINQLKEAIEKNEQDLNLLKESLKIFQERETESREKREELLSNLKRIKAESERITSEQELENEEEIDLLDRIEELWDDNIKNEEDYQDLNIIKEIGENLKNEKLKSLYPNSNLFTRYLINWFEELWEATQQWFIFLSKNQASTELIEQTQEQIRQKKVEKLEQEEEMRQKIAEIQEKLEMGRNSKNERQKEELQDKVNELSKELFEKEKVINKLLEQINELEQTIKDTEEKQTDEENQWIAEKKWWNSQIITPSSLFDLKKELIEKEKEAILSEQIIKKYKTTEDKEREELEQKKETIQALIKELEQKKEDSTRITPPNTTEQNIIFNLINLSNKTINHLKTELKTQNNRDLIWFKNYTFDPKNWPEKSEPFSFSKNEITILIDDCLKNKTEAVQIQSQLKETIKQKKEKESMKKLQDKIIEIWRTRIKELEEEQQRTKLEAEKIVEKEATKISDLEKTIKKLQGREKDIQMSLEIAEKGKSGLEIERDVLNKKFDELTKITEIIKKSLEIKELTQEQFNQKIEELKQGNEDVLQKQINSITAEKDRLQEELTKELSWWDKWINDIDNYSTPIGKIVQYLEKNIITSNNPENPHLFSSMNIKYNENYVLSFCSWGKNKNKNINYHDGENASESAKNRIRIFITKLKIIHEYYLKTITPPLPLISDDDLLKYS